MKGETRKKGAWKKNPRARGEKASAGNPPSAPAPLPSVLPAPGTGFTGTRPGSTQMLFSEGKGWRVKCGPTSNPGTKSKEKDVLLIELISIGKNPGKWHEEERRLLCQIKKRLRTILSLGMSKRALAGKEVLSFKNQC